MIPRTYEHGYCFINSFINKKHCYKDKNLRFVIGSLALNGWCEWGGVNWTTEKFLANYDGKHSFDAHAWLEDEEGNIYDCVFPEYNRVALLRSGKATGFANGTVLEGVSKAKCEQRGLSYYPADKQSQVAMFVCIHKWLASTEHDIIAGRCWWSNGYLTYPIANKNQLFSAVASGAYIMCE